MRVVHEISHLNKINLFLIKSSSSKVILLLLGLDTNPTSIFWKN